MSRDAFDNESGGDFAMPDPAMFALTDDVLRPVFDTAGHVDEGTVHAWLDGAFGAEDAALVADHVTACAACGAMVAEARGLLAASARILGALDGVPSGVVPAADAQATAARMASEIPAVRPRGAQRGARRAWWQVAAAVAVLAGGSSVVWQRSGRPVGAPSADPASRSAADSAAAAPVASGATSAAGVAAAATPEGRPQDRTAAAGTPGPTPKSTDANVVSSAPTAAAAPSPTGASTSPQRLAETMTAEAERFIRAEPAPPAAVSAPMPVPMPLVRGVAGGVARGIEMPRAKRSTNGATSGVADLRTSSVPVSPPTLDRERYDRIEDNPFLGVRNNPLSTFSIDVDRAAFANVRRFIGNGQRPPKDAVRIEELINYFPYDLPEPKGSDPVAITTEVIAAPWQPKHQLVRIALQSKRIATADLPPNNLVFLIDVSGSMMDANKLPLVKQSLRLLVDQLRPQDRVAIVTYAGAAGLVLPSTSGDEKVRIVDAIDRLEAGGSTAGGAGIQLAYRTAREHFLPNGNNRVILATDGDFNVGATGGMLDRLVELERQGGVYLTVLGFGTGNYQDATMESLAKRGNGNYAYVDELSEARKVLVHEMGATLLTVANDVKLQVEFNPSRVQGYRLIGYEDRLLANEDFADDRKDAGDLGTGHQVTALYELVPVGVTGTVNIRGVDSLRYARPTVPATASATGGGDELLFVKLRYKRPGESTSRLLQQAVPARLSSGSADTRFAAAVASFGMLLRDSEYKGTSSAAQVLELARAARGDDAGGYRAAFIDLVQRWRALDR